MITRMLKGHILALTALSALAVIGGCAPQEEASTQAPTDSPKEALGEDSEALCSSTQPYTPNANPDYINLACYIYRTSMSPDTSYASDSCEGSWRMRGLNTGGNAVYAYARWANLIPTNQFDCQNSAPYAIVYGYNPSTSSWVYLNTSWKFGIWNGTSCSMGVASFEVPAGYTQVQINDAAFHATTYDDSKVEVGLYKYCTSARGVEGGETELEEDVELNIPNSDTQPDP